MPIMKPVSDLRNNGEALRDAAVGKKDIQEISNQLEDAAKSDVLASTGKMMDLYDDALKELAR